jgi:acetyl-CoA acetyltransferase
VRPDDLAAHVVRELLARSPDLDPETIDDVLFGNANGAGEDNRNVARMAVLLAGMPTSVPGATVNRLCGSSLDAAMQASRAIESGDASVVLVGGVESMSRAPWVLLKPERGFARGNQELFSTTLGWRMVNPEMPEQWTISLGASARAWDEGRNDWVVPVPGVELERDEGIRPDSSVEKLASLKPAFAKDGTVTAGNASPLNDGAGALLLGDEAAGAAIGREPLARIAGRAAAGVDPDVFGIAPVEAANRALERAGIGWDDVVIAELNEAFASQTLACLEGWPDLDPDKLNVNGGAIAIGHPLGASGVRILATLAHELRRRGGGYGVASICIGVGQGLAVVLEA